MPLSEFESLPPSQNGHLGDHEASISLSRLVNTPFKKVRSETKLNLSLLYNINMPKKIICKECGKEFHNLSGHVRVHGMSMDQYRAKYPNTPVVSEYFKETQRVRMNEEYVKKGASRRMLAGKRPFDFIDNTQLRVLLRRDYKSAKTCLKNSLWKPAIILYGSIFEAILKEVTGAKTFKDAIDKSHKTGYMDETEYHKIHIVRDLRNFVHLHKELEEKTEINEYWAKTFSEMCESIIKRFRGEHFGS